MSKRMSTPGKVLNRMFLSVSRFSTRNAAMVLCLFGCVSLLGFFLAWCSWNPQPPVSGQLNWNHPARQAWENCEAARQSHNDIYFYIRDRNPENITSAISLLSRFVESKKRFFQGSFSSNDFSLHDENSLYHIPIESLETASASVIKCRRITEKHWATLDISNYCQWLTLQLRDNKAEKTVQEDVSRFARSLETAFKSEQYTSLWNLSLNDSHAVSEKKASFGFFAVTLNELDHENKKAVFNDLYGIRQQIVQGYPSIDIELAGIPVEEFQHQTIPTQSLCLFVLGILCTLSVYLLAGFGSVRFHAALFLTLFLGLGCYLGLSTIFMGETTPQTLQIGIVFIFLFLTGAIMMIIHLLHNPLEIRSSRQEQILRSVEHYIRTVGAGKGIAFVALLTVFIIMIYQQTRTLSGIIPESIPTQWLFFALIAVITSFISNLILLPVVLTRMVKFSTVDSKQEVMTDRNPFNRFMLPSWERRLLVIVVLMASGCGVFQLAKQLTPLETVKNDAILSPFYASSDPHEEMASWFHVYDADHVISGDMASKNKFFHSLRTLLMHVPDSGPEIPVSSPAAFDQALVGLCKELAPDSDTDVVRYSLQEMRQVIADMPLDLYYRTVSDFQRSAVDDLCQQLQRVKKSLPAASVNVKVNPEIAKRFKNEEKTLLLIPDFSQSLLAERFPVFENHVQDIAGYSLLEHHMFRETHRSSLIVILILCCVFVFGFLLFNTSFKQSFQNIAVFITAITAFLGMIGFLKIPVTNTIHFVVFTQLMLISVLASILKRSNSSCDPVSFATHFPTIILITGACIVFSGHFLFLENENLLLTGRMIIIAWVATFLSLYLWFPMDKTETQTIIANDAVLVLETTEKANAINDCHESFPNTAIPINAIDIETINEPDIPESVDNGDEIDEAVAEPKQKQEKRSIPPIPHRKPSFCKVWSIGRKSATHKVSSKGSGADDPPVILTMNTVSGNRKTDSKKEVA